MQIVNIHEAKTHLSRLLETVERDEEVIIARAGQPIATLTAYRAARSPRPAACKAVTGRWPTTSRLRSTNSSPSSPATAAPSASSDSCCARAKTEPGNAAEATGIAGAWVM